MQRYEPKPYQPIITSFQLAVKRNMNWVPMGFGKTVATETTIDVLHHTGEETKPALILAPLRVARSTWPNEAAKWDHLQDFKLRAVVGKPEERFDVLREAINGHLHAVSMNYDNVPWLLEILEQCQEPWPFGMIVADESTRLKNSRASVQTSTLGNKFIRAGGGKRASALAKVAFKSERFIELTGTPAPNGLADLWGQVFFIDQGARLGRTFESFIQRWFRPKENGYGSEPLAHAQEEIQNRLKDVVLSLNPKDWFDLKEPIVNIIKVDLPANARKHYREMERELFTVLEGHEVEASNAASRTIKCLQICNGALYVEPPEGYQEAASKSREWKALHDSKLDALESVVEEAAGMPVLIAYHFKPDLARLQGRFPTGRVLHSKHDEDDWNDGKIPVLFAHPQSAGHGLNLQDGGNIICFFSNWWNAELHDQIIERIGPVRQLQAGHERAVFIHYIVAAGTIDEDVVECVYKKRAMQEVLKEAMKRNRA